MISSDDDDDDDAMCLLQGRLIQVNSGGNYLPVGQLDLPRLYAFFTVVYISILLVWVSVLRNAKANNTSP
jgi:hypothetical protein